jgi:hypothetical protein
VGGGVRPSSGGTALRVLACVHFLLKFVDETTSMAIDTSLNHCRSVIETMSVVASDAEQLECVRLQAVECMFAHLNCAMRGVSHAHSSQLTREYDTRIISAITASLTPVAFGDDVFRQSM